jgi:hypothetical protein
MASPLLWERVRVRASTPFWHANRLERSTHYEKH